MRIKLDMGAMKHFSPQAGAGGGSGWQPPSDRPGDPPPAVDPAELARTRAEFMRAVAKVRGRTKQAWAVSQPLSSPSGRRTKLVLRYSAAAAATLLLLVGAAIVLHHPQVVEAEVVLGLKKKVISAFDHRPVPGVAILKLDPANPAAGPGQQVARTNASGEFTLDPALPGKPMLYGLFYQDQELARISLNGEPNDPQGGGLLPVSLNSDTAETVNTLNLDPGQRVNISDAVMLQVEGDCPAWSGRLVQYREWPLCFNYSSIVDGVFELDTTTGGAVRLAVKIDNQMLSFYQVSPEQIRLLAFDQEYQDAPNIEAGFHRGWYQAYPRSTVAPHNPNATSLPDSQTLPIVEVSCEQAADGVWLSWVPVSGVKYALSSPPIPESDLCAFYSKTSGDAALTTNIGFFTLKHGGYAIWQLFYSATPGLGPNPDQDQLTALLTLPKSCRQAWQSADAEKYLEQGEFYLKWTDFTLVDRGLLGPYKLNLPKRVGNFEVEDSGARMGELCKFAVNGNLRWLAKEPAWDVDADGKPDCFGRRMELLLPRPGHYTVVALLEQKNGARIRISHTVTIGGPGISGYFGQIDSPPVLRAKPSPPQAPARFLALTPNMVACPQAFGFSANNFAGPLFIVEPPAALTGVPIKEVRLHGQARPLAKEMDQVCLAPYVIPLQDARPGHEGKFAEDKMFSRVPYVNWGYSPAGILRYPSPGEWGGGLYNFSTNLTDALFFADMYNASLAEIVKNVFADSHALTYLARRLLRLDVSDVDALPPDPELAAILHDFIAGPEFSQTLITSDNHQLDFVVPCFGGKLGPTGGFLVGHCCETRGFLAGAEWDLLSGGDDPAYIEIVPETGGSYRAYIDYAPMSTLR